MWADIGVSSGIISDLAAVEAVMASNNFLVEESNKNDHDNDGISDLYDLDATKRLQIASSCVLDGHEYNACHDGPIRMGTR